MYKKVWSKEFINFCKEYKKREGPRTWENVFWSKTKISAVIHYSAEGKILGTNTSPKIRLEVTCIKNEGDAIRIYGSWTWPHSHDIIPLIRLQDILQIEPVNKIFGDSMGPRQVSPHRSMRIVLVEQMVVFLIVQGSCKNTKPKKLNIFWKRSNFTQKSQTS